MTTFNITIEIDNAAFEDSNLGPELGRILNCVSKRISHYDQANLKRALEQGYGTVKDLNGNTVGRYNFSK